MIQRNCNKNNNEFGVIYKIPDPSLQDIRSKRAAKRPCDLIGTLLGGSFIIESKLIKGFSSFNFNSLEDHQHATLLAATKTTSEKDYVGVFIAFWESRTRYEFMSIDYRLIIYLQSIGQNSIKKKQLQLIKDKGFMIQIKKKSFSLEEIKGKELNERSFKEITS